MVALALGDPDCLPLEIDIGPAQGQQLVAAHAGGGGQRDDGIEDRSLEAANEAPKLVLSQSFANEIVVEVGVILSTTPRPGQEVKRADAAANPNA